MAHGRLDWMAEIPDEAKKERIRLAFQRVAATEDGAIVFSVIFEHLYFFRRTEDAEQQALNNYAKDLLRVFGEDASYRVMDAIIGGHRSVGKQG